MSCNKEKGEGKGKVGEKGKNECSKNICNNQKFTLVLTLKFKSGKTEKLKSQFKSKSSQAGCDLPNEKPFKRARKKLFDSWKNSQKIEGTTKKADALIGIDTQVRHSSSNDAGSSNCKFCQYRTFWGKLICGCCVPNKPCTYAWCAPCKN